MAFAIAALGATGPTDDRRRRAVAVSYPAFFDDLDRLAARRVDRENRQDLPGRLHGRRQVDASRAPWASGSTGGSRTSTSGSSAPNAATFPTIFREHGEPYFRALEREALIDLLPVRGAVVATGGGTFADASTAS